MKLVSGTACAITAMVTACAPKKPVIVDVLPSVTIDRSQSSAIARPIVARSRNFWEAMSNLEPAFIERHSVSDAQRAFAQALDMIMSGQPDEAELRLDSLRAHSSDSLVRASSRRLLTAMLQYQDKWSILAELNPLRTRDSAATLEKDRAEVESWADAFKSVSKRSVMFPRRAVVLPLTLSASGSPMIPVVVNGQNRFFWLDTGSSMSIIASDVAAAVGVRPLISDTLEVATATGRVAAQPAAIARLELGGIIITSSTAMIVDSGLMEVRLGADGTDKVRIDGIIGFDVISRLNVAIDYVNRRVTLSEPQPIPERNRAPRNLFWVGTPIVRMVSANGVALHFNLDTGAQETYSTDGLITKMRARTFLGERHLVGGLGGLQTVRGRFVNEIRLYLAGQPLLLRKLLVFAPAYSSFVSLDGILGSDIGKTGLVRIDATNGVFMIERQKKDDGLRVEG
ncbi:MAG TPA: retropepsin-like aspartic protease [Gemmatimonadaceae bacterium]|nr:retropepsin-like aspartic protease [Gemmatimonadaceae bacterium]